MDTLGARSNARISGSRGEDSHTLENLEGVAMSAKENPTYYRLELDDYSAAAFTSFGKHYYGTIEDLRCFFRELSIDDKLNVIGKTPRINDAISDYYLTESGMFSKQGININKSYFTAYE